MDNASSIGVFTLPNKNLNDLKYSHNEGIYSFNESQGQINNGFPANNIAGFLTISTDYDNTLCIQKITTLTREFYFRTGNKVNNIFTWTQWDRYATVADIPAGSVSELNDTYVTKEEYFPKQMEATPGSGTTIRVDGKKELDSILQKHFKYYGKLTDEDDFTMLAHKVNEIEPYKDKNHGFLLGWFVRETDIDDSVQLYNVPSRKAGVLQIFTNHHYGDDHGVYVNYYNQDTANMDGFNYYSYIYTEFETGDVYTSWSKGEMPMSVGLAEALSIVGMNRQNVEYEVPTLIWDKFSYDSARSYQLNRKGFDFLMKRRHFYNTQPSPKIHTFTESSNTYRSDKVETQGIYSQTLSWKNNGSTNAGIPLESVNSSADYSFISSLAAVGTNWKYYYDNSNNIPNSKTFNGRKLSGWSRRELDAIENDTYENALEETIFNTFKFVYTKMKFTIDRFNEVEIEKM